MTINDDVFAARVPTSDEIGRVVMEESIRFFAYNMFMLWSPLSYMPDFWREHFVQPPLFAHKK